MPRLFILAIGGTGSRVLKSLTMLLASGVKSENTFEIVPVIIDPHIQNKDLKRTERLLDNYQKITKSVGIENGFFSTKITTLNNLNDDANIQLGTSFTYNLNHLNNKKFKEYIDFSFFNPNDPSKDLVELLFSGGSINKTNQRVDLLDLDMDIGFVGNPNIGSIVLNEFKDSNEFKAIASNFKPGDRIFIVSSIFGGTGAAGFPTVLKNIRNAANNIATDGGGFLMNSSIGALTVMPYFNLSPDANSPIKYADFISKTRSALHYYSGSVNSSLNALYYISDDAPGKPLQNDPGANGQQNDAHFIEIAAALSIMDFMNTPDSSLVTNNGIPESTTVKEFAIKNDKTSINFADFYPETERQISKSLSQFALFVKFIEENFEKSVEKNPWSTQEPKLDKQFARNSFYTTTLNEFKSSFLDWLKELSNNQRSFAPINFNSDLPTFIDGKVVKKGLFVKKVDWVYFNDVLNALSNNVDYVSSEQKLIKVFYDSTCKILEDKYGF